MVSYHPSLQWIPTKKTTHSEKETRSELWKEWEKEESTSFDNDLISSDGFENQAGTPDNQGEDEGEDEDAQGLEIEATRLTESVSGEWKFLEEEAVEFPEKAFDHHKTRPKEIPIDATIGEIFELLLGSVPRLLTNEVNRFLHDIPHIGFRTSGFKPKPGFPYGFDPKKRMVSVFFVFFFGGIEISYVSCRSFNFPK